MKLAALIFAAFPAMAGEPLQGPPIPDGWDFACVSGVCSIKQSGLADLASRASRRCTYRDE